MEIGGRSAGAVNSDGAYTPERSSGAAVVIGKPVNAAAAGIEHDQAKPPTALQMPEQADACLAQSGTL